MKYLLAILVALNILFYIQPVLAYQDPLDGLLSDHVAPVTKDGITYNGVDYAAWGQDPRHDVVLDAILSTDLSTLQTKDQKLAYWINAYNVLTIDLITREGETESIKNLGTLLNSPWKKHTWTIAGQDYSLDDIEHGIIRPLDEPRIHFAVNCAAKSCPDLRTEAYRADRLEAQLAEQVQLTFANATKGYQSVEGQNAVRVTKVMDWFKEDFNEGDLRGWLQPYFPDVINDQTAIRFFKYDWSLNNQ